jgi:hypothetical protein
MLVYVHYIGVNGAFGEGGPSYKLPEVVSEQAVTVYREQYRTI